MYPASADRHACEQEEGELRVTPEEIQKRALEMREKERLAQVARDKRLAKEVDDARDAKVRQEIAEQSKQRVEENRRKGIEPKPISWDF